MEDSVSVCPCFTQGFHYFDVSDGHGCSLVATICKEQLQEIMNEEINSVHENLEWKLTMENKFALMDDEVHHRSQSNQTFTCKCELQTPHCDSVGSTVVVIVVVVALDKLVVSNCGNSCAVLCRNGVAIPLSSDHNSQVHSPFYFQLVMERRGTSVGGHSSQYCRGGGGADTSITETAPAPKFNM